MAVFTVTNLNDSGGGSLRAAIQSANSTGPGVSNTINFSVAGTITLASDLPSITGVTAIVSGNGVTGSAPTVGINFNGHGGLIFASGSDGSQLVGLSLGNAAGNGVTLNAGNIVLNNDYIGLALNGTALGNSGDGVFVSANSANNQIGYNPQAAILAFQGAAATGVVSNVISANGGNGISFHGSADNTVVSNRIGTSVAGTAAMANGGNGIWLTAGSSGNTIGGTVTGNNASGQANNPTGNKGDANAIVVVAPPLGNLVSGNVGDGIRIDTNSTNNTLSGNYVGTTTSGIGDLGNQGDGVAIIGADSNSLLGCTVVDNPFVYYNVVSGNGGNGIRVTNSDNVTIRANFIGLGADNATVVGNALDGILINGNSQNTQVGGVIPLGNVVSGNALNGIEVADTASGFSTLNTFGGITAFFGIAPNGLNGVLITSTGGNQTVQTNVLSGNLQNGLEISGDASGVTVVPNIIGLNTRGDGILANGNNGILIAGTAHDNVVGGMGLVPNLSVIRQNTVSGNTGYGIEISGQAYNNVIAQSAIGTNIQETAALANGLGGILLGGTGTGNLVGTALVGYSPLPSPASQVNVIGGNTGNGVTIATGVTGDAVINNWIGLNISGRPVLPNTGVGIQTNGGSNLIYANAPLGPMSAQSPTGQLELLYIGWFGRAADPSNFQSQMTTYLTQVLAGTTVNAEALSLSQSFATSPEIGLYAALGSITTPVPNPTQAQKALAASFINQTFTNLFGHAADTANQAVWQNSFFAGQVPFSSLVYNIAAAAQGSDVTALAAKIAAASYFTTATASLVLLPSPAAMQAAVSGVVNATTEFASEAATNALVGSTHSQITYSSILAPGNITTGVRADLNGTVILTGSQTISGSTDTKATLYQGPLNNTAAGTMYLLDPSFAGGTVKTATFYGPDTAIFDPALGAGNIRAVGSFQYQASSSVLNHGMIYQGPLNGVGGTWTQIDVPSNGSNVVGGTVLGGTVKDTILHSTQGDLVVGNYDLAGVGDVIQKANGFIYNMATQQYTLMTVDGSPDNLTSLYGIWQNGIGSTSYTIAGGTRNNGTGLNVGLLENYDSSTGVFSNLTYFTGNNAPGVITHFENITAVPGGFNLVATTDSGPAFASVTMNSDGSFGPAVWAPANLPGSSLMTGNIAYQNTIGGIYNTSDASTVATYTGIVDQSHVNSAGGIIMPVGSHNFAYALTVAGSVGDSVVGAMSAGNVLGGSIGNDTFSGTQNATQPDTIFIGGGADTITLVAGHTAHNRIELFAANSTNNASTLTPGGVVTSVAGSIVSVGDIPQLGWWGQATAQSGGPVSNATTNAGSGTGTSKDMSTVVNFVTGSAGAPVDTVDISLSSFSNLLRNDGGGSATPGTALFSNLVSPGGTVTIANANVLLITSPTGFANAAMLAAVLSATPITFAGSQSADFNHYIVAYQDTGGSVRIADMDIHRGGTPFTTTGQGQTLSISDLVQLVGVPLASLQPENITFLVGGSGTDISSGQTLAVSSGQTSTGINVLAGGSEVVNAGGTAVGTFVNGGGSETVNSGGIASGTTINGGGAQYVFLGGVATGTFISSGGVQIVSSGGVSTGTTVSSGGSMLVFGTTGNDTFATPDVLSGGSSTINGDLGHDTAVFNSTRSQAVLANNHNGSWSVSGPQGVTTLTAIEAAQFSDGAVQFPPTYGDVNGDGHADIFLQNQSGDVFAWEQNGLTTVGAGPISSPGAVWQLRGTGDFNGDGRADFLLQNQMGDVYAWEQNGLTTIGAGLIAPSGPSWQVRGTGDLNGDGFADIVLQNQNGDVFAWEQNGLTTIGSGLISSPGATWQVRGVGDINGDGFADIILQNQSGDVFAWEQNGLTTIGAGLISSPGAVWTMRGIGDINGDGFADIVLQKSDSTGDVFAWEQSGMTTIGAGLISSPGSVWGVKGSQDINGDGRADIMLQNQSGDVFAWEQDGLTTIGAGPISSPGGTWQVII